MRALIMTSTFFAFAGAEMVALELAEELVSRAWQVDVAATVIGSPVSWFALSGRIGVIPLTARIDVSGYDLVWCQHGTLANIDVRALARAEPAPFIAVAHLSPTTPIERPLHPREEALADLIVANSPETCERLDDVFTNGKTIVSHNPAPDAFLASRHAGRARANGAVRSVLSITNHLAGELYHALLHMAKDLGIAVTRIGFGAEFRRVTPDDVANADLVVTIGKSVPYALLAGTPVYVYDHLGGDGYLSEANFETACAHNFSGRPERRRRSTEEIFTGIMDHHAHAVAFSGSLGPDALERFRLKGFVDVVLDRMRGARGPKALSGDDLFLCDIAHNAIAAAQQSLRGKFGSDAASAAGVPSLAAYFGS